MRDTNIREELIRWRTGSGLGQRENLGEPHRGHTNTSTYCTQRHGGVRSVCVCVCACVCVVSNSYNIVPILTYQLTIYSLYCIAV